MSDVLYIRGIDPPATAADVQAMASEANGCFDLHRVDWLQSCLSRDGTRMMCRYRAADAESVRIALRQLGADLAGVIPVDVLDDRLGGVADDAGAAFIAEWSAQSAATLPDRLLAGADGRYPVSLAQAYAEPRNGRVIGVFRASDQEALAECLDAAGIPPQALWPCTLITPGATAG